MLIGDTNNLYHPFLFLIHLSEVFVLEMGGYVFVGDRVHLVRIGALETVKEGIIRLIVGQLLDIGVHGQFLGSVLEVGIGRMANAKFAINKFQQQQVMAASLGIQDFCIFHYLVADGDMPSMPFVDEVHDSLELFTVRLVFEVVFAEQIIVYHLVQNHVF